MSKTNSKTAGNSKTATSKTASSVALAIGGRGGLKTTVSAKLAESVRALLTTFVADVRAIGQNTRAAYATLKVDVPKVARLVVGVEAKAGRGSVVARDAREWAEAYCGIASYEDSRFRVALSRERVKVFGAESKDSTKVAAGQASALSTAKTASNASKTAATAASKPETVQERVTPEANSPTDALSHGAAFVSEVRGTSKMFSDANLKALDAQIVQLLKVSETIAKRLAKSKDRAAGIIAEVATIAANAS